MNNTIRLITALSLFSFAHMHSAPVATEPPPMVESPEAVARRSLQLLCAPCGATGGSFPSLSENEQRRLAEALAAAATATNVSTLRR